MEKVIYEYWDETSYFDTHPSKRWNHGCEMYECLYKCRIPEEILNGDDPDALDEYIDNHMHEEDFWVEDATDVEKVVELGYN